MQAQLLNRYTGVAPRTVLISGASGLIGSVLVPFLRSAGHSVVKLVRSPSATRPDEISWDPLEGRLSTKELDAKKVDTVVHLSGETIAGLRWTESKKAKILDSRVQSTSTLVQAMLSMSTPPKVLVCASGIGAYGNRGSDICTEDTPYGSGFLAEVSRQWEGATFPASTNGIRVVNVRIAPVLTTRGGLLQQMLLPYKLGLGAVLGDGTQYMSWISRPDVVGSFYHAIVTDTVAGPINASSPNPVTNREFTYALGTVLRRPTLLFAPAFALKLAMGEMADELLLSSTRAVPQKLLNSKYEFLLPEIIPALSYLTGKGE